MLALTYVDDAGGRHVWQRHPSFSVDDDGRVYAGPPEEALLLARFERGRLQGLYQLESGSLLGHQEAIPLKGPRFEPDDGEELWLSLDDEWKEGGRYCGLIVQRARLTVVREPGGPIAETGTRGWRQPGRGQLYRALAFHARPPETKTPLGARHRLSAVAAS